MGERGGEARCEVIPPGKRDVSGCWPSPPPWRASTRIPIPGLLQWLDLNIAPPQPRGKVRGRERERGKGRERGRESEGEGESERE